MCLEIHLIETGFSLLFATLSLSVGSCTVGGGFRLVHLDSIRLFLLRACVCLRVTGDQIIYMFYDYKIIR